MNEAAEWILARLRTLRWTVHDSEVPPGEEATLPRILAIPPAGAPVWERPLDGTRTAREGRLLVKGIGASGEASRGVLEATRTALTGPGYAPLKVWLASVVLTLTWEGTPQSSVVDRAVTIPGVDRHPVFSTDEYELTTEPR